MPIKKGNSRIVIVASTKVIKFPRIKLLPVINHFFHLIKQGKLLDSWKYDLSMDYRVPWSLPWMLFKGFFDNWKEFSFYYQHKLPCLAPTTFSLVFFNIQKKAERIETDSIELWAQFYRIVKDQRMFCKIHELVDLDSFGAINGRIKIVDYASPLMQEMLLKYGDEIEKALNDCRLSKNRV